MIYVVPLDSVTLVDKTSKYLISQKASLFLGSLLAVIQIDQGKDICMPYFTYFLTLISLQKMIQIYKKSHKNNSLGIGKMCIWTPSWHWATTVQTSTVGIKSNRGPKHLHLPMRKWHPSGIIFFALKRFLSLFYLSACGSGTANLARN